MREYDLFIGPQHVGITGNFNVRLTLEGDTVVRAVANPGYLHRGFEKLMEYRLWLMNSTMVCRICVPDPDVNEAGYAMAIDQLMGWEIPERAKYIRTIVLELSRIQGHLLWMGGYAASLGLYMLPHWSIADRDLILELFEKLTGGRVYHIFIWPGGVRWDIPQGFKEQTLKVMDTIESHLKDYDNLLFRNSIYLERTRGIGVIRKEDAIEWGVTGPNLRASGIRADTRVDDPYAAYPYLDFEIPVMDEGDSYARGIIRRIEIEESIKIIRQAFKQMPEGPVSVPLPNPLHWNVPAGDTFAKVESTKGEFGYYAVSTGGTMPRRVHVRGPSYTHGVYVAEHLLPGKNIADVSQILFSLDVCPPDIER